MGLSLVSKRAAAGAACLNLSVFGLAATYPVASIGTKEIVVTDAGAALDGATGSIAVEPGGAGDGEVYTIASAVSGAGVTTITTVEDLDAVDVGDDIAITAVPTAADDVVITHNIPGGVAVAFTCKALDLSGAVANFATSVAPAGTVTVGATYTFTLGTKQVGLKARTGTTSFSIDATGALSGFTAGLYGMSANLGALVAIPFVSGVSENIITYSSPGIVSIESLTGVQITDGVYVGGSELRVGTTDSETTVNSGQLAFPIVRIGISAADIRSGVGDGTLKAGRVVSA